MLGINDYQELARPPADALRAINGGRLNGKTDINPQWRYKAMTEKYGLCGIGWKYTIDRVWTEPATDGQVFAWVQVSLYVRDGDKWSDPIPGLGGNFLIEKERAGLHSNDEGFKMATTDAIGTAMKMIGVAADVYAGLWDGSKYDDPQKQEPEPKSPQKHEEKAIDAGYITPDYKADSIAMIKQLGITGKLVEGMFAAHGGTKIGEKTWEGINWKELHEELKHRLELAKGMPANDEVLF